MKVSPKELQRIIREEVMLHEGIAGTQWWIEVTFDNGRTEAYGPFDSEEKADASLDDHVAVYNDKTWEYTELPMGQEPQADKVFNFDRYDETGDENLQLEIEDVIKEATMNLSKFRSKSRGK